MGVRWYGPLLFLRPAARWPGDLESVLPSADPGHMKLMEIWEVKSLPSI